MTKIMRPRITVAVLLVSLLVPLPLLAKSRSEKRAKIDAETNATLQEIIQKRDSAKRNFEKSYGYAVFDNIKISLGLSGGCPMREMGCCAGKFNPMSFIDATA